MPLKMKTTVQQMVDEANGQIETVSVADAIKLVGKPGVTFIDIRDPRELWRDGTIPGAINVTRGMLEMKRFTAATLRGFKAPPSAAK